MKRTALACVALLCLGPALARADGQEKPSDVTFRPVPQTPAWQQLRSLVGHWEGWVGEGEQRAPTHVEIRMTGGGSAVMHVLDRDTPHEMVTMFHPDGDRLLATHYCAAHNQPRMALAAAAAPNQLVFEFVDGTNIGPEDVHMKRLVITVHDADHHDEAWTSQRAGREEPTMVFKYTRRK